MTEFNPEFYHVYTIDRNGTIGETAPASLYAPDVEHDDEHDVLIEGCPPESARWSVLVDHSGQDRYHGAVMHASELWGDWAIEDLAVQADTADPTERVAFAVVEVSGCDHQDGAPHDDCDCDECSDAVYCQDYGCPNEPAGWAVVYQIIGRYTVRTTEPAGTIPRIYETVYSLHREAEAAVDRINNDASPRAARII